MRRVLGGAAQRDRAGNTGDAGTAAARGNGTRDREIACAFGQFDPLGDDLAGDAEGVVDVP